VVIGYSPEHPEGTFRMFDPITKGVHVTRDVTWLRRKFFPAPDIYVGEGTIPLIEVPDHALQAETTDSNAVNEEARADEPESTPDEEEDEIEEDTHTVVTTGSGRAIKMPSYLLDHFETALVGAGIGGGHVNTNELHTIKFDDAMKSPEQSLWAKAVELLSCLTELRRTTRLSFWFPSHIAVGARVNPRFGVQIAFRIALCIASTCSSLPFPLYRDRSLTASLDALVCQH
jgi:hypothetical protein